MRKRWGLFGVLAVVLAVGVMAALAPRAEAESYHHGGDTDSLVFLQVHPEVAGTKLDSCALCHCGGEYVSSGKTVVLGSCQWCHYKFKYDGSGDILATINPYGLDYMNEGKDADAILAIEAWDSDADGFSNADEIAAIRFPGDANDDPTKVEAPYHVYDLAEIEMMPAHTQFQLMNTHKSGDYYAAYTGVPMEYLLADAGMLGSATGIQVFAPDGFANYFTLEPTAGFYNVFGTYPQSTFYYDPEADRAVTSYGWCDYSEASCEGRENGDVIEDVQKMLLAYKMEGEYLDPGVLNVENKLDGDGPFRVVPPQRIPGPPDQSSKSNIQDVIWPFDEDEITTDHNAGSSPRSATIVRVEPLPEGTTDIDTMEAGWGYIDQNKIVVYGAIDPIPTVLAKTAELQDFVLALEREDLRGKNMDLAYAKKLDVLLKQIENGAVTGAEDKIANDLLPKVDGVIETGSPDGDDWVTDPIAQRRIYWSLQELLVLLAIDA